MNTGFMDAIKQRRSIYALGKNVTIERKRIEQVLQDSLLYVPSAFNSQSARIVLLWDKESHRFWSLVKETLRPLVPEKDFSKTEAKLAAFDSGVGTILFFEDQEVVEKLMSAYALYKDNFPIWSLNSSGMVQFTVWTELENLGLGASLQHYNPLVDEAVKKEWNLSESWKLWAQMPFGSVEAEAGEKQFAPLENRLKIIG